MVYKFFMGWWSWLILLYCDFIIFFPISTENSLCPIGRAEKAGTRLGKNINGGSLNGRVINLGTRGGVCTKYFHRLPLDGLVCAIDSLDGLLHQPAHDNGPHAFSTKAIAGCNSKPPFHGWSRPKSSALFRFTPHHRPLRHPKSGKFSISSSDSSMAILLPISRAGCGFFFLIFSTFFWRRG